MTTTDIAVRERDPSDLAPRFVVSLDDLAFQLNQLQDFKKRIMVEGEDFGVIPGTPKPTLLKPGAEKLALAFGLTPMFSVTNKVEDWERGFFFYEVSCELISKRTGEKVANGIGSANSKEPRYRWRDAKPTCPNCGKDLRRSRNRDGEQGEPGWYCWAKQGGCGANYPAAQITGPIGRIENPEPYELVNTLVKMAQKRALVAGVLVATGGSGIWTQDIEDMPSVSGEQRIIETNGRTVDTGTGEVMEQHPPAAPPQSKRKAAQRPPADPITSVDDPLYQRYSVLYQEAVELGLSPESLDLSKGLTVSELTKLGQALTGQIAIAQAQPDLQQRQQEDAEAF